MSSEIVVTDSIYRSFNSTIKEIDPYSEADIALLKEYDQENHTNYFKMLDMICHNYSKEEYELLRMTNTVFKLLFYSTRKNKIDNICLVEYETDLKRLNMYIDNINKGIYKEVTEHAFKNMDMESVTVFVNKNDEKIIHNLLENGYIPLYDSTEKTDIVPLLLEKGESAYKGERSIICV